MGNFIEKNAVEIKHVNQPSVFHSLTDLPESDTFNTILSTNQTQIVSCFSFETGQYCTVYWVKIQLPRVYKTKPLCA